jgi:formamidase
MTRLLHIVGAQVSPVAGDPEATVDKFAHDVRLMRGSFPKAQLFTFPELYLTGEHPFRHHVPMDAMRHRVPGPFTERLGEVARRAKRWIQAGSIYEAAGRKTYNTALLFAPDGSLVATYRKLFPWMPLESSDPGQSPPPVTELARIGKAGMMICYDGWFPEVARSLAIRGAEVILHPTLTTTPDREEELVLARANAIANQCYVINVNASVEVGGGRSIGVDPEGRVLFEGGGGEEFFSEVLDLDRVRTVRERGTRGLNRLLWQLEEHGPKAADPDYRALRSGRGRAGR